MANSGNTVTNISRQAHKSPWKLIVCVVCVAGKPGGTSAGTGTGAGKGTEQWHPRKTLHCATSATISQSKSLFTFRTRHLSWELFLEQMYYVYEIRDEF